MKIQKAKHVWSVLCEKSTIDSDSNNITLFNITEQINIPKAISVHVGEAPETDQNPQGIFFNRELVTLWRRDTGAELESFGFDAKIELIDPKGKLLQTMEFSPEFQHFRRLRTRINWQILPTTLAGEYLFRVLIRDGKDFEMVSEVPLEVVLNVTGVSEPQMQFAEEK
ncbi:MAG TPA: hypothetical protein VG934_01130 [Candidatus Paceibacterota bacterium]|nr:hypothetical protein [Candidatus Paceibacterota bacterium]